MSPRLYGQQAFGSGSFGMGDFNAPVLIVEIDKGELLNGAKLNDDLSAKLDSAILEYHTPTFSEDITAYVRGLSIHRGGQRELQRVEAGTASVLLDNRSGRFTPFNPASPYYPYIRPMTRFRVRATWDLTYPVYYGYSESLPVSFPEDVDTVVQLQLVDGFKILSLANVSGDFPSQSSGARVAAILDAAIWPPTERTIATGTITVPATTLTNVSALEHIQAIEQAEAGRFFIGRDGKAVFRDRTANVNPDFSTRTWADNGTGMSYREVTPVYDDTLILNDVRLTRTDGIEQVSIDFVSQGRYGIRSKAETGLQLSSDGDVLNLANLYIDRFSEPVQRLERLVDNAMKHGLWDRVLARDINDIALAIESRTNTSQPSTIEGIEHSLEQDSWTVTFTLSPSIPVQAGILDDATYGLLDSTAILAA